MAMRVRSTLTGLIGCLLVGSALALSVADLTNQDAARGIKGALAKGAASAIAKLGVPGGFLDNPKVKIPLPPALDEAASTMEHEAYRAGIAELYAAEVLGEGLAMSWREAMATLADLAH